MDEEHDQARVKLAIEHGGEAISGVLEDEHGVCLAFWGWLELIAALEAVRGE